MKAWLKALISIALCVAFMLVLPWVALKFGEGLATTGLWFFAFFALNPMLAVSIGVISGTDARKLWYIPLVVAALFPPLFSLAIADMVWDLYVYSAIYLPLGVISMVVTHLLKKMKARGVRG